MPFPSIFIPEETEKLVARIESLTPQNQPLWGKMTVSQMMAHCAIPYEMDPQNPPKIGFFLKWMMRNFFKKSMLSEKPYQHHIQTAPLFRMVNEKDFYDSKYIINMLLADMSFYDLIQSKLSKDNRILFFFPILKQIII